MTSVTSGSITSADGTGIAFEETGTGPALVLVNGAMSYRASNPTGSAVAQALADRNTVYNFDRRGRGESGDADTYSVQAEVDDIAALVDHAGGEAALAGFSSGAVLALEAALAGVPVTGLALWEPPFIVSTDRPPVAPDVRERVQQAVTEGRPGDAVALFLTETVGMPAGAVEPMRSGPQWIGMEQLAPTLAYDAAVMGDTMSGDPASLRRYDSVGVPTLVMLGGASDPWMAAGTTAIAGILPNARHEVLPDQNHAASPEALIPVLSDWLSTLAS